MMHTIGNRIIRTIFWMLAGFILLSVPAHAGIGPGKPAPALSGNTLLASDTTTTDPLFKNRITSAHGANSSTGENEAAAKLEDQIRLNRTIRHLYNALNAGDCEIALEIYPALKGCAQITAVSDGPNIHDQISNADSAYVHLSFDMTRSGDTERFDRYVLFEKVSGQWMAIPNYAVARASISTSFRDYAVPQLERRTQIRQEQAPPSANANLTASANGNSESVNQTSVQEPKTVELAMAKKVPVPANRLAQDNSQTGVKPQPDDAAAAREVTETLTRFYDAVADGDCEAARRIRKVYNSCEFTSAVRNFKIHNVKATKNIGLVHFSIEFEKSGEPRSFDGYVQLDRGASGWKIGQNKYTLRSRQPDFDRFAKAVFSPGSQEPVAAGEPAPPSTQPVFQGANGRVWRDFNPRSFGSAAIMNSCFSPGELAGKPGEKKTRRTGPGAFMEPLAKKRPDRPDAVLSDQFRGSIRRVDTNGRKLIALGFDIGERNNDFAGYDAEIIQFLRKYKVKATLYMGGKWLATHPERALQLVADPLFEIGNHAWTHGNFGVLNAQDVEDQIYLTEVQYEKARNELARLPCAVKLGRAEINKIPVRIPTFRFPYGTCTARSLKQVNDAGLPAVQWNVVTADPDKRISPQAIANAIRRAKPGSIVVAHANGRGWKTGRALPLVIPQMLKQGWEFVTVSELLTMGRPVIVNECYELRPGDNLRYNKIFGRGTGD